MKRKRKFSTCFFPVLALLILGAMTPSHGQIPAGSKAPAFRDLYPDTWVAVDGLGRSMPSYTEAGPVKHDQRRVVGIFYITWHSDNLANMKSPYEADVSKILAKDPTARLDADHPLWKEGSYHWGEPEAGYFLSRDKYVIRKDMSMLADAGVDVLIMDVTNAVRYWDEWDAVFSTMQEMKAEGNKVPQFCFWAFNGPVITVVQDLYEKIYKTDKYRNLWFYWDGKPLLLYNASPEVDANGKGVKHPNPNYDPKAQSDPANPHYGNPDYCEEFYQDYTQQVKDFFTFRNMWWGYYEWAGKRFVGTEDNWSFGYDLGDEKVRSMDPTDLVSLHQGQREEAAVTPGQHPSSLVGKSWSRDKGEPELNEFDLPVPTFVPWLGKTVEHPEGYGIYFQDRWNEALKANPQFLYINDWNEWTAGKYPPFEGDFFPFMRRKSKYFFVDQYNSEFNRCLQPMKRGYTDNYYMQMAENIRRYKGIRPAPVQSGFNQIRIDGSFADWQSDTIEYRDTRGDVIHRDYKGYGGLHYTDSSGRNDIVTSKVAFDKNKVYFYTATDKTLTCPGDPNWMLLFIDADNNPQTGWNGFDYMVNKSMQKKGTSSLMHYNPKDVRNPWKQKAVIRYALDNNELELEIPRKLLGIGDDHAVFNFKWSDNAKDLNDIISICTSGDTAPNRRFSYHCTWNR